jgi:hypothetical protein
MLRSAPDVLISILVLVTIALLAVVRPASVIEVNIWDFLIITWMIAGWAGWMSGRAIAGTWRPHWHVVLYMVPFSFVVRWVHFALFKGTLLSLQYLVVDFAVIMAIATLGYRIVRAKQMTSQYRWLYMSDGPFAWKPSTRP